MSIEKSFAQRVRDLGATVREEELQMGAPMIDADPSQQRASGYQLNAMWPSQWNAMWPNQWNQTWG